MSNPKKTPWSIQKNPPSKTYDPKEGIDFIKRIHGNLPSFIKVDPEGNSLNPRKKELEEYDHEGLTFHNGVLYDKELMVVEKRKDGELELISGYGRCYYFQNRDIDTFMVDVVTFENEYYKAIWKRRFNASVDHVAKGIPNTEGSILKGLSEARAAESFNWRIDEEVRKSIRLMEPNGSKSEEQVEKLLKKWRQTNHQDDSVRGLNTAVAKDICDKMGLPYKGYQKDLTKESFGRITFIIKSN